MTRIAFQDGTVQVDPALVAKGLRLDPQDLRQMLRSGQVTSLCEKGEGEDAGRFRLTFFSPNRRLRLVVDAQGEILKTTAADYSRRQVSDPSSGP